MTERRRWITRHRHGSVFEVEGFNAASPFFIQVFLDRYDTGYEGQGDFKIGPLTVSASFYGWAPRVSVALR